MIEQRFGVKDISNGWFYFPISRGGLEVWNPVVDFLSVRDDLLESPTRSLRLFTSGSLERDRTLLQKGS